MANERKKTKTKQNNSEAQKPKQKCVKNDGRWGREKRVRMENGKWKNGTKQKRQKAWAGSCCWSISNSNINGRATQSTPLGGSGGDSGGGFRWHSPAWQQWRPSIVQDSPDSPNPQKLRACVREPVPIFLRFSVYSTLLFSPFFSVPLILLSSLSLAFFFTFFTAWWPATTFWLLGRWSAAVILWGRRALDAGLSGHWTLDTEHWTLLQRSNKCNCTGVPRATHSFGPSINPQPDPSLSLGWHITLPRRKSFALLLAFHFWRHTSFLAISLRPKIKSKSCWRAHTRNSPALGHRLWVVSHRLMGDGWWVVLVLALMRLGGCAGCLSRHLLPQCSPRELIRLPLRCSFASKFLIGIGCRDGELSFRELGNQKGLAALTIDGQNNYLLPRTERENRFFL